MNKTEHLLSCLAEECCEVGQRVSKALRFTLAEVQPGQPLSNAERISQEMNDLLAVAGLLVQAGIIPPFDDHARMIAKVRKVAEFAKYSRSLGAIADGCAECEATKLRTQATS